MNNFEPLTPYVVDPEDRMMLGRLEHASHRGDKQAKVTLRALARAETAEEKATPPEPAPRTPHRQGVQAGRDLFRSQRPS